MPRKAKIKSYFVLLSPTQLDTAQQGPSNFTTCIDHLCTDDDARGYSSIKTHSFPLKLPSALPCPTMRMTLRKKNKFDAARL
ncbi:hypothetical protein ACHAWT_000255 [Skeletonema menzelii]